MAGPTGGNDDRPRALPDYVTVEAGGIVQTTVLWLRGDAVVAFFVMRNPDKLGQVFRPG